MTFHQSIAVLLVALLAGCPFVCLAQNASTGCRCLKADQPECCSDVDACCHDSSGNRAPTDDSSNRPEPDCACKGAVAEPSIVECADSGAEGIIVRLLDLDDDALSHALVAVLGSRLSSHFSLLVTGREICALTCARLL
jgi:hypothetical protein